MSAHGIEAQVKSLLEADQSAGAAAGGGEDLFGEGPVAQLREATRGLEPRGPGRPPGSVDRRKLDMVRLIRATKRPTLLAIKELVDTPVHELARMLGCSRLEAFKEWRELARLMAAYEEGTPIQRVDLTSGGAQLPVVAFLDQPVRADLVAGNPPAEAGAIDVVDFQVLSEGEGDQVSQSKSHSFEEGEPDQGFEPT